MSATRERLEALLEAKDTNPVVLRFDLEMLAQRDPQEFSQLADLWATALYRRDPQYFATFLSQHLNQSHAAVIVTLLPEVRLNGPNSLLTRLRGLTSPDSWHDELRKLALAKDSGEQLAAFFQTRQLWYRRSSDQNTPLEEDTAIALYERDHKQIRDFILQAIDGDLQSYARLLETAKTKGDGIFYWNVFTRLANADEWRGELEKLLSQDVPANTIVTELEKRHPRKGLEIDPAIGQAFIDKYGNAVMPYLEAHFKSYLEVGLQQLLTEPLDNSALLQKLSAMAQKQRLNFRNLADIWTPALYERDPQLFESFLREYLRPIGYPAKLASEQTQAIQSLLPRLEAEGNVTLFSALYAYIATEQRWNDDLLALAKSDKPDQEVQQAIARRNTRFTLDSKAAAALYQRNPELFGAFVAARVRQQQTPDGNWLLYAAKERGDSTLYWSLFRQWATAEMWQAELQTLLSQDIVPEQIADELEKRHPNTYSRADAKILKAFIDKYGESVMPYVERHFNLVTRERLDSLLALPISRAALLRELNQMARQRPDVFQSLSEVWATALMDRDPVFFEGFLVRNLGRTAPSLVYRLMERAEQGGQDSLFKALYRQITREEDWNYELRTLATSDRSDDDVYNAVMRREPPRWASMSEDTALLLYQRNPALFGATVKKYVRRFRYIHNPNNVKKLRDAVQAQNDDALYWYLFREFADQQEWNADMERLLAQDVPAERITEELDRRLPEHPAHTFVPVVLLRLLEKYGAPIVPYTERYIHVLARSNGSELMKVVRELGDEGLYWRVFFQVADSPGWNAELHKLWLRPLTDDELLIEVEKLTPDTDTGVGWRRWNLTENNALALYRRQPVALRPFLERFMGEPPMEMVNEAMERNDEEFLDFLIFKLMQKLSALVGQAYVDPRYWGWRQPNQKARDALDRIGQMIIAYFERLYAQSPETYVRHAANILGRFRAFEVWRIESQMDHNPIFSYLARQHHDIWYRSPDGIRELMESPNIYVQLLGLDILSAANPDTAQRVVENLMIFRALLLGRTRRNTKKKVLLCLENAMQQGPQFAGQIAPVLEAAVDFHGRRAISSRILVSLARARHVQAAQETQEVVV